MMRLFVQIYDGELENIPKFNKFEDSLRSFDFHGFNENDKVPEVIATLKVLIINLIKNWTHVNR